MNFPSEVLYIAPSGEISEAHVQDALANVLNTYEEIFVADRALGQPIIDREIMGIVVAYNPDMRLSKEEGILAIGSIGQIKHPPLFEKFLLKAVARAHNQRRTKPLTDIVPMHELPWVTKQHPSTSMALHRACAASVNGLPVGFAGGWPHHSRSLAVSFARSLAHSLELPVIPPDESVRLVNFEEAAANLRWLNHGGPDGKGHDAGDNTLVHQQRRNYMKFVLDLVAFPSEATNV